MKHVARDEALQFFYGGTFDPVHNGHMAIARAARDEVGGTLRLMPAADPPHRAPPGADALHRARMLDLAVAGEPGLVVDRRELQRQGRSYTIDTLRELRLEVGPSQPLALLIGADSLLGLPTWREWRTLFELAHFVVAPRPGSPVDTGLPPELAHALAGRWTGSPETLRHAPAGHLYLLNQPLQPESASEVRRRISAGEAWQDLVPGPVAGYILARELYSQPGHGISPV
ncbi:MAG: nicotinate-nucleotide adenylyltransferase [Pseudoxanthomonas sp.]